MQSAQLLEPRRVVALAVWVLKTFLHPKSSPHLGLQIPPAASQIDSGLSTALFWLLLQKAIMGGEDWDGNMEGGWRIGRVMY